MVGSLVAVDPCEDGVKAGRDEAEREEVAVCVRSLVGRVDVANHAAVQAILVGNGV